MNPPAMAPDEPPAATEVVYLSQGKFLLGCLAATAVILVMGRWCSPPAWVLAAEVFATILGLFLLGSMKYQLHKNALTYGMGLVIAATFLTIWWPTSSLHQQVLEKGVTAAWPTVRRKFLTFHGLDDLVHLDTMLFILGLTYFVSVIAQTRALEGLTVWLLRRFRGNVLATVICVTAAVAAASGVLAGVSMIGLTIRTLVIVLLMAAAPTASVRYAVMVCTVVTTVSGMWLAYGEPPNLIMKANLIGPAGEVYLSNSFFINYCLPAAVISYLVIAWSLRKRFKGSRVDIDGLDILDANAGAVRFLQASRHGEVLTAVEFVEDRAADLEGHAEKVLDLLRSGTPMGVAMIRAGVTEPTRKALLGEYVSEDLAADLDSHYLHTAADDHVQAKDAERAISAAIEQGRSRQRRACWAGGLALIPFLGLLVMNTLYGWPLFYSSFAGFAIVFVGIAGIAPMRRLALHEARIEYAEYYFLFPLFVSITLLTKVGFFDTLQAMLKHGIDRSGPSHIAAAQFFGATFLSALLDNNVVADFASHALHGLSVTLIHLFAMAQIAGYAAGGCWTHIGSAQSVIAYAFIRRDVDEHYTPLQWIREMTPVLLATCAALTAYIYLRGFLLTMG